jgi:hypothetical protein
MKKKPATQPPLDNEELAVECSAVRVGRPSSYSPDFVEQAFQLCLLGATDAALAAHFGVAESTLYAWKHEYPEFSEAIKKGKLPADAEIANALFNRAKGMDYDEEVPIKLKEVEYSDGKRVKETERVEVVVVRKVVPPDPTSMIFWLKNRKPDQWRDKQSVEHSGGVLHALATLPHHEVARLLKLPDEELRTELARLQSGQSES